YNLSSHATSSTEIYTLSLHDALPIFKEIGINNNESLKSLDFLNATNEIITRVRIEHNPFLSMCSVRAICEFISAGGEHYLSWNRSEEHTSELQSRENLVCRLLLEKKK